MAGLRMTVLILESDLLIAFLCDESARVLAHTSRDMNAQVRDALLFGKQ